jgi:hypothetical protein
MSVNPFLSIDYSHCVCHIHSQVNFNFLLKKSFTDALCVKFWEKWMHINVQYMQDRDNFEIINPASNLFLWNYSPVASALERRVFVSNITNIKAICIYASTSKHAFKQTHPTYPTYRINILEPIVLCLKGQYREIFLHELFFRDLQFRGSSLEAKKNGLQFCFVFKKLLKFVEYSPLWPTAVILNLRCGLRCWFCLTIKSPWFVRKYKVNNSSIPAMENSGNS